MMGTPWANFLTPELYPSVLLECVQIKKRRKVGTNTLWNQRIRDGLEEHLAQIGYRKVNDGEPNFLVTYFMGIKEKYDIRYIDYGFPGRWGTWGPWGRW